MTVREFRMTIAGRGYNKGQGAVQSEFHFKATRSGKIQTIRRQMAERGVEYYQRTVRRMFGFWIPKKYVRIGFERESSATKSLPLMSIEVYAMWFKGRRHQARRLPSRVISYHKRRRQ